MVFRVNQFKPLLGRPRNLGHRRPTSRALADVLTCWNRASSVASTRSRRRRRPRVIRLRWEEPEWPARARRRLIPGRLGFHVQPSSLPAWWCLCGGECWEGRERARGQEGERGRERQTRRHTGRKTEKCTGSEARADTGTGMHVRAHTQGASKR